MKSVARQTSHAMRELVDATTPSVLEQMRKVVATVPVGYTTLLDLYSNKVLLTPS